MDFSPGVLILFSLFCSVAGQAPDVSVEPRAATVRQGESASFRCQVQRGAQPIQLVWKKANNQALPDNVKTGPDGSVLTVANAGPENQGQYRCVASNSVGPSVQYLVEPVPLLLRFTLTLSYLTASSPVATGLHYLLWTKWHSDTVSDIAGEHRRALSFQLIHTKNRRQLKACEYRT
uniref:Ig-like domain-containing protein n=1 Tax=Cyclopterus lumpus TaxID=8103 RepID=A0A8C2WCJ2_CYCLU